MPLIFSVIARCLVVVVTDSVGLCPLLYPKRKGHLLIPCLVGQSIVFNQRSCLQHFLHLLLNRESGRGFSLFNMSTS